MKNGRYPSRDKLSPIFLAMIDDGIKEILKRSENNSTPENKGKLKRDMFSEKKGIGL